MYSKRARTIKVEVKPAYQPIVGHQAGAYPGFCSMKRLRVFLLSPGWDASSSQGYPSIKVAGTHLYTWVERDTVRVKSLAQEHNTMSPARAPTRTARSGVEHPNLNYGATKPPTERLVGRSKFRIQWPKYHLNMQRSPSCKILQCLHVPLYNIPLI